MSLQVRSLALLRRLRIWRCSELWCRSQIAAWVPSCCGCGVGWRLQLIRPLALEPPHAQSAALEKGKQTKELAEESCKAKILFCGIIFCVNQLFCDFSDPLSAWWKADT